MKYIILALLLAFELSAGVLKSPILSIDEKNSVVTIGIDKIDVGMSGFIAHSIDKNHTIILKSIVVSSYDADSKKASLKMSAYDDLNNDALPNGKWKVQIGDMAVLAFGYTRGLLIAPNDEIYHRITKSTKDLQWIHPDIFATILSFNGHPTPLREDFSEFRVSTSVGLLFFYLDGMLYTVDAKSFKILTMTETKLEQESAELPFYTRVEAIDAAWWGEGSEELLTYEPHYYKLLFEANPDNEKLKKIVENFKPKALK